MSRTSVTVHLPDELLATIKSLAADEERSRNQVICRLLSDALTLPRVVNDRGELRGFVVTTGGESVPLEQTAAARLARMFGPLVELPADAGQPPEPIPPDLSIPAPTGDVMKEAAQVPTIPGVAPASSLPRPATTERPEFKGPIPKGGKK